MPSTETIQGQPRYAELDEIERCQSCGHPTIEVEVATASPPYTVREHIYVGAPGQAIKGKTKCPETNYW